MTAPDRAAWLRLAWKYETLAELRRARERGEAPPPPRSFRTLAAEFPSCLVELDTLPLDVLDARALALREAAEGATPAPWMAWMRDYHALLRAALWLKPRVSRQPPAEADAERLAHDASTRAGAVVDAAFVRAVANPPRGRLSALVLDVLAERHACPVPELRRALFPRGRDRTP